MYIIIDEGILLLIILLQNTKFLNLYNEIGELSML